LPRNQRCDRILDYSGFIGEFELTTNHNISWFGRALNSTLRRIRPGTTAVVSTFLVLSSAAAIAQEWPQKPVTLVVPYQAGGNTDVMARLLAESLARQLGKNFIVENRGGVGGAVGADVVARSAKDGYTLLFATTAQLSIVPLVQNVHYDPATSFEPISIFGTNANVLAISNKVPASSVPELIAYSKAHPGGINYASGGTGTVTHLAGAMFGRRAGIEITHVPYRGGSQMVAELAGGHVQLYIGSTSELLPMAEGAGIKLLASTSASRLMPSLPTVGEVIPGYIIETWNGLLAPVGLPREVVARLEQAAINAAREPATQEMLKKLGIEAQGSTAESFKKVIAAESATYGEAIAAAGIAKQ
jgi:tripartite-type tricarboxylate transporter receptor subunit TctC